MDLEVMLRTMIRDALRAELPSAIRELHVSPPAGARASTSVELPSGISVKEAARRLGCSQNSVRRMISTGELAAVKLRNRLVIPSSAIATKLEVAR